MFFQSLVISSLLGPDILTSVLSVYVSRWERPSFAPVQIMRWNRTVATGRRWTVTGPPLLPHIAVSALSCQNGSERCYPTLPLSSKRSAHFAVTPLKLLDVFQQCCLSCGSSWGALFSVKQDLFDDHVSWKSGLRNDDMMSLDALFVSCCAFHIACLLQLSRQGSDVTGSILGHRYFHDFSPVTLRVSFWPLCIRPTLSISTHLRLEKADGDNS